MALKKEDFPGSALGSKHIYQGVEYVAVNDILACDGCSFDTTDGQQGCDSAPRGCGPNQTVWMTPADAITRRLTA